MAWPSRPQQSQPSPPQPGAAAPGAARQSFGRAAGVGPAMPEALRGFLDQVSHSGLQLPSGGLGGLSPAAPRVSVPHGAQFLTATLSNEAGSRPYNRAIRF